MEAVGPGKLQGADCQGLSYVIVQGDLLGFIWLVLNWKRGQKLGKLSVLNHQLVILGPLSRKPFSLVDPHPHRARNLASCKSDLQQPGLPGCLLFTLAWGAEGGVLMSWAGSGSLWVQVLSLHLLWHWSFLYSDSQADYVRTGQLSPSLLSEV